MTSSRIVVGVDGSEPSKAALRWALRQADLTGATVEAVIAWEYPINAGSAPVIVDDAATGKFAATALQETVDDVTRPGPPAEVRTTVAQGNSARVLLNAAADADLLVIGSRGHGGFAGLLLGSVSQHCVSHANCPVVVIRDHVTRDQQQSVPTE